jgi:hypothetical protein
MSRKPNTVSAALAFAFILLAVSSAFAQTIERRVGPAVRVPVELRPAAPASLGCCKCLGGTNSLDLSTIASNAWTVNGNAAVFLSSIHPAWNVNPGPASWVSTAATGGTGGVAAGVYEYRLDFVVPACTIEQRVTLTGNVGGDDNFDVFLDNVNGTSLSQCAGWCFNTPRNNLHTFTSAVASGTHTLIVRIRNDGGPSGMFVNAKLVGACRGE